MKRFLLLALVPSACLRDLPEIPPTPAGAIVTGEIIDESHPVEHHVVEILGSSVFVRTDAQQVFRFEHVPVGRPLSLAIRRRSPRAGEASPLARVLDPIRPIIAGQVLDLGRVRLGAPGTLRGSVRVREREDIDAARGAVVLALPSARAGVVDAAGRFTIEGVPEGSTEVVAVLPRHRPARLRGISVPAGALLELPPLVLGIDLSPTRRSVSGSVHTSDDATPPITSSVRRSDRSTDLLDLVVTPDGAFTVDLDPGVYLLRFSAPGYVTARLAAVVTGEEDVILDQVTLAPGSDEVSEEPLDAPGRDTDGDGLDDAEEQAEGRDGAITDPHRVDTDDDGVRDADDRCPSVADTQEDADADGTGDACDVEPILRAVSPGSGRVGDPVTLRGLRLDGGGPTAVAFGDAVALAENTDTSDVMRARVPAGATSAPLRLVSAHGVSTSTTTFVVLGDDDEGPRIYGVSRAWAPTNGPVDIDGAGFSGSPLVVSVGGVIGQTGPAQVVDATAMPPRERVEVTFDRVTSGPVTVESRAGRAVGNASLAIVERPRVTQISPSAARVGEVVRIQGLGFDTRVTGGRVEVVFAPGVVAPPDRSTDHEIEVRVPTGASSGALEVLHPAGTALSSAVLTISPEPPRVTAIMPRAVSPGQTTAVLGERLDTVRTVRFRRGAGTVDATRWSSSASAISVVVPTDATAGAVELVMSDGASVLTPPLMFLRETSFYREPAILDGRGVGFGFDGAGARVFLVTTAADRLRVRELDASTWVAVQDRTIASPVANTVFRAFQVAPTGTWGVLVGDTPAGPRTWVVDLPAFAIRGSCADRPAGALTPTSTFRFDGLSSRAYAVGALGSAAGEDTILRVNQVSGACERIASVAGAGGLAATLVERAAPFALVVTHRVLGLRRWEPAAASYVGAWDGVATAHAQLFWDPDGLRVWGAGGPTITRFSPGAVPAVPPLDVTSVTAPSDSAVAQSSDRRWLLYTGRTGTGAEVGSLLDLTHAEVVGTPATDLQSSFGVIAHPVAGMFVGAVSRGGLARYEIEE